MMDADVLFPKGCHPVHSWLLPDASDFAPVRSRSSVPLRYYFVDYGISSYFDPAIEQERKVLGLDGIDREVPELSNDVSYDPFKVDIFIIGNMIKQEVYQVRQDLFKAILFYDRIFARNSRTSSS
jgi:hypothetical protein